VITNSNLKKISKIYNKYNSETIEHLQRRVLTNLNLPTIKVSPCYFQVYLKTGSMKKCEIEISNLSDFEIEVTGGVRHTSTFFEEIPFTSSIYFDVYPRNLVVDKRNRGSLFFEIISTNDLPSTNLLVVISLKIVSQHQEIPNYYLFCEIMPEKMKEEERSLEEKTLQTKTFATYVPK
jgi:hypothetical protein